MSASENPGAESMRGNRMRSAPVGPVLLVPLIAGLLWALGGTAGTPAHSPRSTPGADPESTPLSVATVDDITISLLSWRRDDHGDRWVAELSVASAAASPVVFDAGLVFVTAIGSGGAETALHPDPGSTLPCTLVPGESATLTLYFSLAPEETASSLQIGLLETNRSGARVVFPLAPGAGASARGGDGAAGADARGGDSVAPSATPGPDPAASPVAEGCRH